MKHKNQELLELAFNQLQVAESNLDHETNILRLYIQKGSPQAIYSGTITAEQALSKVKNLLLKIRKLS